MEPNSPSSLRRSRAETTRAINTLLERQHGVVSHQQLSALGLSRQTVQRRIAAGLLHRVHQNVYAARPGRLNDAGRRWGALLGGGAGCALAFTTAADELDLVKARASDPVHILQLGPGRWPLAGVARHRTQWLPTHDLTLVNGRVVTTPPRTLLDSASLLTHDRLEDMLDRAVLLRLYDGRAFDRVMRDRPTLPGVPKLALAIARLDATAGQHRNRFERRTTALIRESRIVPVPAVNAPLSRFRPDLLLPGTRGIIECDGRDYHRSPAQLLSDELREVALLEAGYVILRLRWSQVVYEPERTLRRIERFYLANTASPHPGHPGRVVF